MDKTQSYKANWLASHKISKPNNLVGIQNSQNQVIVYLGSILVQIFINKFNDK